MGGKRRVTERVGRFFTDLTDRVYRGIASGPIGRLFTSYPEADRHFRNSAGMSLAELRHGGSKNRPLRRGLAQAVDHSFLRRAAKALTDGICRCSMRTIGAFTLTTGLYCALITWLVSYVWQESVPSALRLYGALGMALIGLLLLLSNASLAYVMENSVITHWLLHAPLGFSEDVLKDVPQQGVQHHAIAIPLGMLFGALGALIDPIRLLAVILGVVLVMLVLSAPEAGVILLLAYAPFYSFVAYGELWLTLGAFFVLASYFVKLLRGTRVFRMEIQDLMVLALLLHTCVLGVSAGDSGFFGLVHLLVLIALYFPVANMFSAPQWMLRARWTLLTSATAAALLGIFQFVLAAVLAFQGGGEMGMGMLGQAVRAGFADHGTFAYFMVLAFPFSLHMFMRAKARYRMPAGFVCVAIVAAVALTWVQSAWIAIFVELIVFCLLCERKFFPYFSVGVLLSPAVWFLIPRAWRQSFLSMMRVSADVSAVRMGPANALAGSIFFENGVGFFGRGAGFVTMLFGLGYGGIEAVSVLYTTQAEQAVSGFSFWLYRLLEGGILGIILPLVLFFFVLQNCFSLLRGAKSRERAVGPVMGVAMIFGVLAISIFRYAWHDSAAFMLFFASIALLGADARARRAGEPILSASMQSADCASMEYQLSAPTKQKKANATLPEVSEKRDSIELSLDDPEAVAIVEALIQEQKVKEEGDAAPDADPAVAEEARDEGAKPAESAEAAETPLADEPIAAEEVPVADETASEAQMIETKESEEEIADESEEK